MTWEMVIIAAFRIAGSLPVLRWAFIGALVAMLTDLGDLFVREAIDLGGVKDYQRFDKWLDQVYMLTFLIVALRWAYTPRVIAIALYAFRLIGFVAFEISGSRDILLFFPNVFEYWFVFVAGLQFFKIDFHYSRAQLAVCRCGGARGEARARVHAPLRQVVRRLHGVRGSRSDMGVRDRSVHVIEHVTSSRSTASYSLTNKG